MNLNWNKLLLIILLFWNITSLASEDCPSKETILVFSNGMFNSLADARNSKVKLQEKFGNSFAEYGLAHNHSESAIEQLLQVYEQKASSIKHFYWSYLSRFSGPDWFRDLILMKVKSINAESYVNDADLRRHVRMYKEYLNRNYDVVIVAHSQGNFYANNSFDFLGENLPLKVQDPMKIISVANPDNRVAGGGGYVTLRSDGVIRMIPFALPYNTENQNPGRLDHQFVKNYLEGDSSGAKIASLIGESKNTGSKDFSLGGNYDDDGYLNKNLIPMKNWLLKVV